MSSVYPRLQKNDLQKHKEDRFNLLLIESYHNKFPKIIITLLRITILVFFTYYVLFQIKLCAIFRTKSLLDLLIPLGFKL